MSNLSKQQTALILEQQRDTANIVNSLLEKSKDSLLCGPDCQNQKVENELEQKYLQAKAEVKIAPTDLEKAKKNYLIYTQGESAYNETLNKDLRQKVDQLSILIEEKLNEQIEQAKILNTFLNTDILNSKNTIELYNNYFIKNEKTEKLIKYSQGDILTNDRKSFYENQENDNLKNWYNILLTSYYILALIYFSLGVLQDNNLNNLLKIIILILLIIFPYIIDPIFGLLIQIFKKIKTLFPKDVYL